MSKRDKNWQEGTAVELADAAADWLEELGHMDQRPTARLVRYYVLKQLLTPPKRKGKEAIFGIRQLRELVVARELATSGWSLAKIAAWSRDADEKALLDLVLAVNDDPESDLEFYEWLASRGVAVLRAYSTDQALALLERARPHIVVSDLARIEEDVLNKRAGMNLASTIRKRGSDVPIVIYTMDKSPHVADLVVEAGANYVTEDPGDLRDWLEKMGI
jgi:CheY-like chemotaxis protein